MCIYSFDVRTYFPVLQYDKMVNSFREIIMYHEIIGAVYSFPYTKMVLIDNHYKIFRKNNNVLNDNPTGVSELMPVLVTRWKILYCTQEDVKETIHIISSKPISKR